MKKTHKGKTALQLLKGATVKPCTVGMKMFWIDDFACSADEDGNLIMWNIMGNEKEKITLKCGQRARARIDAILAESEAMMDDDIYNLDLTEA